MAVKNESFLVLEDSLASRVGNAVRRGLAAEVAKIASMGRKGEFTKAHTMTNKLDVRPFVEKQRKYIELVGMQAILYGARDFRRAKNTSFAKEGKPVLLDKAVETMILMLSENGNEAIKAVAHKMLETEEAAQKESQFQVAKAATDGFVKGFVSSVSKTGKGFVDMGSSLHTSRLASWGFTKEAQLLGHTSFMVSEVLDGRTCKVCKTMDGKVFPVAPALKKLEGLLSVDNPNDLKSMAPWPKQDKASLDKFTKMSDDDLMKAGWDTPPYHPGCRGILRRTKAVAPMNIPLPRLRTPVEEIAATTVTEAGTMGGVASQGE